MSYPELSQMGFHLPFSKHWGSVKHDWRNAIKVSFESILLLLYDKHMVIVIHHTAWSN